MTHVHHTLKFTTLYQLLLAWVQKINFCFLPDATNCNLKLLYSSHSDCHDWRWLDI